MHTPEVYPWPEDSAGEGPEQDRADHPTGPASTHAPVELIPSLWADTHLADPKAPARARRKLVTVAAAAGLLAAGTLGWLLLHRPGPSPVAITPAEPSVSTSTDSAPEEQTAPTTLTTSDVPPPTGQPVTGPAADVAAGFAADYVNVDGGKDDWLNRLSHWTTPQLADGYRATDPNRLPEGHFQRLSAPLNNDSGTVLYNAFFDTMTLEIRCVFTDDHWQVAAALNPQPANRDVSPPGSTPAVTTPYIPPDIGAQPA